MKVRLQLYTVPGQVFYNATRKLVLKGVDGVVFVADSQAAALDDATWSRSATCKVNLAELGLTLDQVPIVFQYNKRDIRNILPRRDAERDAEPGGPPALRGGGAARDRRLRDAEGDLAAGHRVGPQEGRAGRDLAQGRGVRRRPPAAAPALEMPTLDVTPPDGAPRRQPLASAAMPAAGPAAGRGRGDRARVRRGGHRQAGRARRSRPRAPSTSRPSSRSCARSTAAPPRPAPPPRRLAGTERHREAPARTCSAPTARARTSSARRASRCPDGLLKGVGDDAGPPRASTAPAPRRSCATP